MAHFCDELAWRGLFQDCSDPEGIRKLGPGASFYVGFDPTAPSLQLGNLVPLSVALLLARHGLKPIILFGGATGSIGDPSGRNSERQLLARELVEKNVALQKLQVEAIFRRAGTSVEFVDNYDWTHNVSILDFLRDVGKHFTVNYMIAKEVVKSRLGGDGISYTEFSYMLLQSFDFLHLLKTRNCALQFGASDQWGNVTAGLELIRRREAGEAFGFSFPLLLNSQGKKFGKSEAGAIWLDPQRTSPYQFHQFFLRLEDADIGRYLKIFTSLSADEISAIEQEHSAAPQNRKSQKVLADAVCTLVHGPEQTELAKRSAEVLFGGSLSGIPFDTLEQIFSDVPSSTLNRSELLGKPVAELFALSGIVKSKGEARRLIESGGAYINNERVQDAQDLIKPELVEGSPLIVLRSGKKNYHLAKLN